MAQEDDRNPLAQSIADESNGEWKHPLQTLSAYGEAIGRWTRQSPMNAEEISLALDGMESALGQLRQLLSEQRQRFG